ncbi:MAG TPA: hybrid sensor histidine kinase/response regulator [Roseiflexaceae bacterium]|nr:hybrid sensor histidine kinase/response regulator [Roseiflexaceae bacterium]HMP41138.1 hybrid sensor histidine kinase/response regulator [Roseiflexaceae bacterium]
MSSKHISGRRLGHNQLTDQHLAHALADVARHVSTTLDLHTTLEQIFDHLGRFVPFNTSAIMLVRDEGLSVVAGRGFPASQQVENVLLHVHPQAIHYPVIAEHRTIVIRDTLNHPGWQRVPGYEQIRSWIGTPLEIEGHTIGMLTIDNWEPNSYTERHAILARAFASHVAVAVHHANLYAESQRAIAELHQAQLELLRRDRLATIGQLTSGIAHDFNNMLTGILGTAQLLQWQILPDDVRKGVDLIADAAQHAATLTRRLQQYTRTDTDRPLLPVDLKEVAELAIALTRPRWQSIANLTDARIAIDQQFVSAYTTPAQAAELLQVAINLILNAADAMPNGGTLTIATGNTDEHVFLLVRDTGNGIASDLQSRIFEPFVTTKGNQGTGMGLAMSRTLVELYGGWISLESTPGHGSSFTAWLPRGTPINTAAPTALPVPATGGATILVIDDNPNVCMAACQALRTTGHSVDTAATVAAASMAFLLKDYEVVITNLSLPDRSGWDLVRWIRHQSATTGIIILSGWSHDEINTVGLSPQIDGMLTKPYTLDELRTIVATTLSAVQARSAASTA